MTYEKVRSGEIVVPYSIYQYDDGMFDWVTDGRESDELFDSAEEAEQDAIQKLGG